MKTHRSLVPLIAAGVLAAAAPTAHAEVNRSFDFRTPVFVNDGRAHTWGLASFKSARRVVLTGRLNDECPADGYGAYLDVTAYQEGGGLNLRYTAKDIGGCKDKDGIAYSFDIRSSTRKITSLSLKLYECDTDGVCGGYGNEKIVSFSNPY
jgi:hypothetical protein